MNARSFFAAIVLAGAVSSPAQVVAPVKPELVATPAPIARVESYLSVSKPLRALVLQGEPGRPYAIFVGPELAPSEPIRGVHFDIEVNALLAHGTLDMFGYAFVPVDPQARYLGVERLYFQALLWPVAASGKVPDEVSNWCELVFEPFQTIPPDDRPSDSPWVSCTSPGVQWEVELFTWDAIPHQQVVWLLSRVPSTGYVLRFEEVLHAGDFTRVMTSLERPADGELVAEVIQELTLCVPLGMWVGSVEVFVRDVQRTLPEHKPVTPVSTGN